MLLKRLYDHSGGTPKFAGVRVLRAGRRQRFSQGLVDEAVRDGWMALADGRITVRGVDKTLTYRIVRGPGYYCCYCGEPQPGAPEAKAHVTMHVEAPSNPSWFRRLVGGRKALELPDPQNPSGYRRDNFYECVRED